MSFYNRLHKQLRENSVSALASILVLATTIIVLHTFSSQLQIASLISFRFLRQESSSQPIGSPQGVYGGRPLNLELHPEDHVRRERKTWNYKWEITTGIRAPDGVEKTVYLINGQFPGPVIEARSGDTIIVEVVNELKDNKGLSVHWHGLHMRGNSVFSS